MIGSVLGQIANPQMADIAGALDVREARIARDEARRKEIRIGQLVAEAMPGLKKDGALYNLAREAPQVYMQVAKAAGIPMNSGEQMQEFSNDVTMLYQMAQQDPKDAYEWAVAQMQEREKTGRTAPYLQRFVEGMEDDPVRTITGLNLAYGGVGDRDQNVQSSKTLPGGITQMVTRDGKVIVKDAAGRTLTGDAAVLAIEQAEARDAENQRNIYSARREGTLSVDADLRPSIEREVAQEKGRGANVAKAEDRAAISQEEKIKMMPKATNAAKAAKSRFDNNIGIIDEIAPKIDALTAGFSGSMLSSIKGSEARDVMRALETIKANVGFNELNEMRQNSPTGGALGNVTERELAFLQSVIASLEQDQSPSQLRKNLERVKKAMTESWGRVADAYEQEYGRPLFDEPVQQGGATSRYQIEVLD